MNQEMNQEYQNLKIIKDYSKAAHHASQVHLLENEIIKKTILKNCDLFSKRR